MNHHYDEWLISVPTGRFGFRTDKTFVAAAWLAAEHDALAAKFTWLAAEHDALAAKFT